MSRYLNILFRQQAGPDRDDHPDPEDLACLAQGCLEEEKRGPVMEHVLNCDRCYQVVEQTMAELEKDRTVARPRRRIFKGPGLAVAASILTAVVGVGVYYNLPQHEMDPGPPVAARQMMRGDDAQNAAPKKAVPPPSGIEEKQPLAKAAPEMKKARKTKGLEEKAGQAQAPLYQAAPDQSPAPQDQGLREPPRPAAEADMAPRPLPSALPREEAEQAPAAKSPALGVARARPKAQAVKAPPSRVALHLRMDDALLTLLKGNRERVWTDMEAVKRLEGILRKKLGREVNLGKVSWEKSYPDRLGQGTGPEFIIITLENGEALLSLGKG